MTLLELGLLAFGPFTDVRLDLSQPGAVHLIYGPNEAGKSTALRAITNVLYGIPVNTQDAHRHAMPDLRIAARVSDGNGRSLGIVRRKGAKNTLLDTSGNPLGEDALAPLLAGVSEAVFRTMFGLDHVTLRAGAEALLQGKGAVGESLFAAAIGGPRLHALLAELDEEAVALYNRRSHKPLVNEAIKAYLAADKRSRDSVRSADAYRAQQEGLTQARAENAALVDARRALGAELSRLQRALRVLPLLTRRMHLAAQRAALGDVPRLAEDAATRRTRAQAEHDEALREQSRLAADIAELEERRATLRAPESMLAIDPDVIETLQNRVGSVRAAAGDVPRRRGELGSLEQQAAAMLGELGRSDPLDRLDPLRIPATTQARVRALAHERSGLSASVAHAAKAAAAGRARLVSQREQLAVLPPVADLRVLQQAVQRAQRHGDIDEAIETTGRSVADLESELRTRLEALPLWQGDQSALRRAPLPAVGSVDQFRQRFDQLAGARNELAQRRREVERRTTELTRDLDELRLGGTVPTEGDLDEQRRRRDALWQQVRQGQGGEAVAGEFDAALRAADHVADRLRREAGRVASLARLTADRTACASDAEALQRADAALAQSEERLRAEWAALWSATGIQPLEPTAMSGWIARAGDVIAIGERWEREANSLRTLEDRRARQRRQLIDAAGALSGAGAPPQGSQLAEVVDWVVDLVQHANAASTRRQVLADALATGESEQPDLEGQATEAQQHWDTWQQAWEASIAPLGLTATATPEEALAVLDQLGRLFAKVEEMTRLQQRIDAMEGDAQRLAHDVAALARTHARELAELPAIECADQLIRAHRQASDERRERMRLDADLQSKRERARACEEGAQHAGAELRGLMERAAVAGLAELEAMERAAAEAARLDRLVADVDEQLVVAGEGASTDALIEQTRGLDPDAVKARIAEVESELEELGEAQRALHQQIGSLEAGVQHQENAEGAAEAAAEAQEHLAAIRGHVRKYLRLRLASMVIRREIERYRAENQGPLVARASALFPRLTLDRYSGVCVGFDANDEPVLQCVDASGREKTVNELSDGARDQLYLALRIATLERHAESNPTMPVVLDDILVHFDDERTSAALAVLGELAQRTQVLLFTHHARVVELARTALPAARRVEHVLTRSSEP